MTSRFAMTTPVDMRGIILSMFWALAFVELIIAELMTAAHKSVRKIVLLVKGNNRKINRSDGFRRVARVDVFGRCLTPNDDE